MTLTDTGPLVALINRNDPNHTKCVAASRHLPARPLVTTWPCFTEAMYLLFRAGGYAAQEVLWRLAISGRLVLHDLTSTDLERMAELMKKYHDKPMDLADVLRRRVCGEGAFSPWTVISTFIDWQTVRHSKSYHNMTSDELKRELALALFQQGRISFGKAREVAGMTVPAFQQLLGSRGICVHVRCGGLS